MFKTLKSKFPYHGDISRVIRNAIKAINKGVEFTPEGDIVRINNVPTIAISIPAHLSLIEELDDESLKKIAIRSADSINDSFYIKGVHSKEALHLIFSTLELSNIISYKWVEQEEQSKAVLIYIEKTIYPPRIMSIYFNEYIKYFCKINRLSIEISGSETSPIYRITTQDGSVFI